MTDRPDRFNNLRQFQCDEVIRGVLRRRCDFCGESLLGDDEITAGYVMELIRSNGPLSSSELIDIICVDMHDGCCSHCSNFLDKE